MALEWALVDDDVVALAAALPEHAGMFERGDRAVLGERALVAAGQLASVRHHRGDLALGGPPLDAAPDYLGSSE